MKKILIITDNAYLYEKFRLLIEDDFLERKFYFSYRYSESNTNFIEVFAHNKEFLPINLKNDETVTNLIKDYYLVISLHCKQIFPKKMVDGVKCINVHPGYNPYNRGWFPQVFSIINKKPVGVTIHEIDHQLDHGNIIVQEQVPVLSTDTSFSLYNKILEVELELLKHNLVPILEQNYTTYCPPDEGNINYYKDFKLLCEIDLDEMVTYKEAIDRFRALTHGSFANAYFIDEDGNKVFISITLAST